MAAAYDIPVIPHGSECVLVSHAVRVYELSYCRVSVMSPRADELVPLFGELFTNSELLPNNGYLDFRGDAPGWGVELNTSLSCCRPYENTRSDEVVSARYLGY